MNKAKFSDFGLDVAKNFLHAKRCENGNECLMYADNKADAIVKGCCEIISQENVKAKRAIFIIHEDKNFHMVINDGNKIDAYESESPFDDPKEVGKEAEDYGIEEYGLVCWDGDNFYKVIEE